MAILFGALPSFLIKFTKDDFKNLDELKNSK